MHKLPVAALFLTLAACTGGSSYAPPQTPAPTATCGSTRSVATTSSR
jgi:hypothetical protein